MNSLKTLRTNKSISIGLIVSKVNVKNYTDIYSFFDEENPKNVTIYAKNLKYGLRMSKLQN